MILTSKIHNGSTDPLYWEQQKWFHFTTTLLSPQQGNLSFYLNFAEEKLEYCITRSRKETLGIYNVMESRVKENNCWFVGGSVNIFDISAYTFVRRHDFVQVDVQHDYPLLWEWLQRLNQVGCFEKGYAI